MMFTHFILFKGKDQMNLAVVIVELQASYFNMVITCNLND